MRTSRLASLALAATAALGVVAAAPATASLELATADRPAYEPQWAPAGTAAVHPGTQVVTGGGQCTSNFVFAEVATVNGVETLKDLYLGMAAHCSGTEGNTATNGCVAGSRPLGTEVSIDGATKTGTLAYNSWLAMQDPAVAETDQNLCRGNDFALVRIDPADYARTNPSLPYWGGPVAVNTTGTSVGEDLYSWGNSGLRLGLEATSPKVETKAATSNGGWSHVTYAVSPGIPGDSGSGHVDSQGRAFGVTSTLILAPYPAGNGITDLGRALANAETYTGKDLRLVTGTEAFRPL